MRRKTARVAVVAVALVGALAVWLVSTRVFPYHSVNHDEAVYLQQAAMLLEGQLALVPPLEDVFRPWFFVDAGERLYPKYTPIPAGMFALGELLGSYRLALPAIAAGVLGLTAGVVSEAFDRRTGVLAAVFVLGSPLFLLETAVFLPYAPTALLELGFAYAYLRADRLGDVRWAAAAGGAIGLAFFARPFTAVLFAAPFVAHAAWTLRDRERATVLRQLATAGFGLVGVTLALAYNVVVTGSPLVFPYEAFAPLDGLGFGTRRILGHEVQYTPELAVRANAEVVRLFLSEWIAGGFLGALAAAVGLALAVRRGLSARKAAIAGLFVSVAAGNVIFWGNLNVLGDIERAGDGLVASLGPYYHYDLLLPTAAFAAYGLLAAGDATRDELASRAPDARWARFAVAFLIVTVAAGFGAVTVAAVDEPLERNFEATETYERAYEPFADGSPSNSLVLLPTPHGDWLNHPFQALRNDPGFDGRAVYAMDERPFDLVEAYPNRTVYRYVYRGPWAPGAGSPRAARLQRVRAVEGARVTYAATVGVPRDAAGVTVRLATEEGSAYYVGGGENGTLTVRIRVENGTARVLGDVRGASESGRVPVEGRETIRATAFVDVGPAGGFTYRFDVPVSVDAGSVRALSPRVGVCRGARSCGSDAAFVPTVVPEGTSVNSRLSAERNP